MKTPLAVVERVEAWVDPTANDERDEATRLSEFLTRVLPPARGLWLEATGTFPDAELRAFAAERFVRSFVPEDQGGHLDWARAMRTATRLAAHDLDVALCLGGTVLASIPVLLAGSSAQRAQYFGKVLQGEMGALALSEENSGSDLLAGQCMARAVDDAGAETTDAHATGFLLDGDKAPSNNATRAANLVVLARTSRTDAADASSHTLFLVARETRGLEARAPFDSVGYRSMDLSGARFEGARVGRDAVLGKVGEGFLVTRRALEISRSGVACMAVGAHASALAQAVAHAKGRYLYGSRIGELGGVRRLLANVGARLVLASALARRAVRTLAAYGAGGRGWSSAAKLMCPWLAEQSVHDAGTILGAASLRNDLPFGRLRRAAPVLAIFDGSSQLQLDELWRHASGWAVDATDEQLRADSAELWDRERVRPFTSDADDGGLVARLSPPSVLARFGGEALAPVAAAARKLVDFARVLRGQPQEIRFFVSEAAGWLAALAALVEVRENARREGRAEAASVLDACVGLCAAHAAPLLAMRLTELAFVFGQPEVAEGASALLSLASQALRCEARVADALLA